MSESIKAIALEARLRDCRNVLTLGVRPNFSDYTTEEASLIRNASKIYYPSSFYADLFDAIGKNTFPSYHHQSPDLPAPSQHILATLCSADYTEIAPAIAATVSLSRP